MDNSPEKKQISETENEKGLKKNIQRHECKVETRREDLMVGGSELYRHVKLWSGEECAFDPAQC